MTSAVFGFLRLVGDRPDLLDALKTRSKDEVIAAAAEHGFAFTEAEFDTTVWDAEAALARHRGEEFDAQFGLWQTMWGRYYLEYLVTDLVAGLEETGIAS